ncbi:MAG: hypothetical protein EXS27_07380 [Pedosphaera sp.]|nr:hypothetical protein [Pedosphaera sp.]
MVLTLSLGLATTAVGCRQKASGGAASTELDKAERVLATAPATPAPSPGGPPTEPAPAQQMKQAVEAYKGGKLEDAVTRLQALRATTSMTPQQRMALNDAMAAVMADIYALAAKGDARAIQAVKQYEKLQTQKR